MGREADIAVEDDDFLKRGAQVLHAAGFVVLLLLAAEDEADAGVAHHELYRLFACRGIERHGACTDAPCAEVGEDIFNAVL